MITGGAGFIGSNLASYLIRAGHQVMVFDNLSRPGSEKNLAWLKNEHGDRFRFHLGDVRDYHALRSVMEGADIVYHLAAQVAVTSSVADPRTDFEINALGTFNALEAARMAAKSPIFVFTSTNKVYGEMTGANVKESSGRHEYAEQPDGIGESQPMDFHSPYGCSKGAADQYVLDYHRIYGLRSTVFRMSCIYGPHQFGNEDQGWLAHFVIAALLDRGLTIYGDGKQVRDALCVLDLVRAFDLAAQHIDRAAGQVYNIGGGPDNTVSLLELIGMLEARLGKEIPLVYADWRPGDQRVYISDIRKAREDFGWAPRLTVRQGLDQLLMWIESNSDLFRQG
jgi:CDP-paratose 2-epimerase